VGRGVAKGTLTLYKTAYVHLANFISWKYQADDLEVKYLDYEFVSQFIFWLKTEKDCEHNTALKYLGNLKKIVLDCMKKGWLIKDPFLGFTTRRNEVVPVILTKSELSRIINKTFDIARLDHVRDIFIFCCYTGLAYSDVFKLSNSDIIIGIDGEKWIDTARTKTGSMTRLPLLPQALNILAKYQNSIKCANKGSVLPVLTNQKMNAYLKEIADVCSIEKILTFHVARHTFATTITLSNGVPIETVSKMMGHKTIKQTQHYAKIIDLKMSKDMKLLKKKLN